MRPISGWWKWLVRLLLLAIPIAGVVYYWESKQASKINYQTQTITHGKLVQMVTGSGQLNPVMTVQVGSQISGIIQKLFADFNSSVRKDDIIAQIDPATYQANLTQARGELANAKAALGFAAANKPRAQALFTKGAVSQAALDKANSDFDQAQANVQIKEAAVVKAEIDLARCTIYAPIDGVVVSRNVDVGQTVAASLSAPILFLIANDLAKMQIDANISEADIGQVKEGQEVIFTVDAYLEQRFPGKVRQVRHAPLVVQNVVTYDTVIDVDNSGLKLKPGMTANVSIIVAQRENILQVSNAAFRVRLADVAPSLSSSDGQSDELKKESQGGEGKGRSRDGQGKRSSGHTVYILPKDGLPQPVEIKTGISDGTYTEVLAGLHEGDVVITGLGNAGSGSNQTSSSPENPFGGKQRMRTF